MRKFWMLFLLVFFITSGTSVYAASDMVPEAKPAISLPKIASGQQADFSGISQQTELSKVRWANHKDTLTGADKLRLVMDVSGPVEATGLVIAAPTPRLVVTIKGTVPGNAVSDLTFDGKIVEKVSFDASGQDTKVTFDLPVKITDTDYKVFTLRNDPAVDKPFRVCVDLSKPVPLPSTAYTAGMTNKVTPIVLADRGKSAQTAIASGQNTKNTVARGNLELGKVRWANHKDALTGTDKLRLVMDVSGPVEAAGTVVASPTPQLVVTLKGVVPGNAVSDLTFDGKVLEKVSFNVAGQDTKVSFDLPIMIEDTDYEVFALPGDPKLNKPFRVVVDVNKPVPLPDFSFTAGLKDKVIAIDPGHGGSDPGAIGPGGYQEKAATLAVARNVRTLLEKAGARVVMTRQDDRDVYGPNATAVDELKARSTAANIRKADVFVSIHADSFSNPAAGGTSTYYYQKTRYDSLLARSLQTSLLDAGNLQDRRANPANFYVIKRTQMPAALVELAFISNPTEEKLLSSPEFQQKMSLGIVQGLERFFNQASKLN